MAIYQMNVGAYEFEYNPTDIQDKIRINRVRKPVLSGEISYIQKMSITRDISLKGSLKATAETTTTQIDNFRVACMATAPLTLYLRSDRIFRIYPTEVSWARKIGAQHLRQISLNAMCAEPYQMSATEHTTVWDVSTSGDTDTFANAGNKEVEPAIQIVCDTASLINPVISDGTRSLTITGTMSKDDSLVIARDWTALLNGSTDWSGKLSGDYPQLAESATTTLTYTDDGASSHDATVNVVWRDFWH